MHRAVSPNANILNSTISFYDNLKRLYTKEKLVDELEFIEGKQTTKRTHGGNVKGSTKRQINKDSMRTNR